MNMYYIGDKVKIKNLTDVSGEKIADRKNGDPTIWTKRKATTAGSTAIIVDKMYSEARKLNLYLVQLEENGYVPSQYYCDDDFSPYTEETVSYITETQISENLVIARLYEVKGDQKTEIGNGHGHIFHDGALGIAQATSYAFKKLYTEMNGGSL